VIVTGLVFDLPQGRWMDEVTRLRSRHDPVRLRFPIEITVVGSSGLGWFSEGQTDLMRRVGEVARACSPFSFRFDGVKCFPESSAYYLSPADDIGFHDFQRRLANCGLRFEPSPYEYVPHCTIAILAADAAAEAHAEVRAFPVPSDNIRVSSVSFWSVDQSHQVAQQGQRIALGA
jgi:2'-5' RNA ligase